MTTDFSKEIDAFLDELADSGGDVSNYSDFMKVRLYPAYVAFVKGDIGIFSVLEHGKEGAQAKARAHLDKNGMQDKKVRGGIVMIRYGDSVLNKKPYNWEGGEWRDIFTNVPYLNQKTGEWSSKSPQYVVAAQSWSLYDEQGNDVSPVRGRWGKELWAEVASLADPTFDKDDQSTWTQYNSYETDVTDKNTNETERKTFANRIRVLKVAFDTKEELVKYMTDSHVELFAKEVGGASSLTDEQLAKIADKITPFDKWSNGPMGANDEAWKGSRLHILKSLAGGATVDQVAAEWEAFATREDIVKVNSLLEEPPF